MDLYAVISLQERRSDKLKTVHDTVQYISSDLEAARQVFNKITTADFNFEFWRPITKYIIQFKDGQWFSDGLINENEITREDFPDVLVEPGYSDTL
jgi:hypothetical protein